MKTPTDLDVLNQARNKAIYSGSNNSIIAWTLSPEWTQPYASHYRKCGALVPSKGLKLAQFGYEFSGEISNAH